MVKLLLSAKARTTAVTGDRQTALHFAARAGAAGQVVDELLAQGSVDARDRWGRTPLHWAVVNGHRSVVVKLLAAGADRLARDVQQETPLSVAERRAQCRASDRGDRGASVFGDIARLLGGTASTEKAPHAAFVAWIWLEIGSSAAQIAAKKAFWRPSSPKSRRHRDHGACGPPAPPSWPLPLEAAG